mmetsp:Transcript_3102/g.12415  ORF Transcript_3102/g.12415 Transcript_3102/m.12415 type:complete len:290 (-) Transcript_3102:1473-2342(-)
MRSFAKKGFFSQEKGHSFCPNRTLSPNSSSSSVVGVGKVTRRSARPVVSLRDEAVAFDSESPTSSPSSLSQSNTPHSRLSHGDLSAPSTKNATRRLGTSYTTRRVFKTFAQIKPTLCSLKSNPASAARSTLRFSKRPPEPFTGRSLFAVPFSRDLLFLDVDFDGFGFAFASSERAVSSSNRVGAETLSSSSHRSSPRYARVAPELSPSLPPTPRTRDAPRAPPPAGGGISRLRPSASTARLWKMASAPPAPLSIMNTADDFFFPRFTASSKSASEELDAYVSSSSSSSS